MIKNKNIILYEVIITAVFLIAITFLKTMDITVPVYLMLSFFPLITGKKLDLYSFIYIAIIFLYSLFGIIFQDMRGTMVSLVTRYFQFIVLFWVYSNSFISIEHFKIEKITIIVIFIEAIIAIYIIMTRVIQYGYSVRIIAGNQPVGGNFSIILLPVLVLAYYQQNKRVFVINTSIILLAFVIISGTRGYLLVFLLTMFPIYLDFYSFGEYKNRIIIIIYFLLPVILLIISRSTLFSRISLLLRLSEGTGVRTQENRIAIDFIRNAPIIQKVFGIGFGERCSNVPAYVHSVNSYFRGTWAYFTYINKVGVSFHNYLSNVLLLQGLLGLALFMGTVVWGVRRVLMISCSKTEKNSLLLFWIGFIIMNLYRWSCDCGIAIMLFFSMTIKTIICEGNDVDVKSD